MRIDESFAPSTETALTFRDARVSLPKRACRPTVDSGMHLMRPRLLLASLPLAVTPCSTPSRIVFAFTIDLDVDPPHRARIRWSQGDRTLWYLRRLSSD